MGKKINPEEYVGQEFTNKSGERFKVICFQHKDSKGYNFDIEFVATKNVQLITLNQIRAGTCIDRAERKRLKRIKTELQLRERTRLVNKAKHTCVIPSNLKEKNVLAVDLSTTSTGIAYSRQGIIVRWKTIKSNYIDPRERSFEIVRQLVEILEKGMIDVVILEDVYLGLNSDVLTKLSEVRGMLTYHIKKLNLDLLLVPAVLWKHRIEGVPVHRQEQKEFMMKKFFEYTGVEADSDDSADAYMMLKACLGG